MQRSDPSKLSGNAHNDMKDVDILNWDGILVATMTLSFHHILFQLFFSLFSPSFHHLYIECSPAVQTVTVLPSVREWPSPYCSFEVVSASSKGIFVLFFFFCFCKSKHQFPLFRNLAFLTWSYLEPNENFSSPAFSCTFCILQCLLSWRSFYCCTLSLIKMV